MDVPADGKNIAGQQYGITPEILRALTPLEQVIANRLIDAGMWVLIERKQDVGT